MVAGQTRVAQVYERLRADILAGHLQPGERLKFPHIATHYGASVGVFREALARLQSEGFVRTEPHRGFQVVPLSVDDLVELNGARTMVEGGVLELSVREGDVAWEGAVVSSHHVLMRTPLTHGAGGAVPTMTDEWAAAHSAFHEALLSGCRNPRLRAVALQLRTEAELYRRWSVTMGDEPDRDLAGEHRALAEAALARDAQRAAQLLRDHIAHTTQLLVARAGDRASRAVPASS